jgi:high-affinity Fe2+/Pb2+ permease
MRKATWALLSYVAVFGALELGLLYTALTGPSADRSLGLEATFFTMIYFIAGLLVLSWIWRKTRAR